MKFVLDCSVAMAWCFEDETNAYTQNVLLSFQNQQEALVPKLWQIEVANVLLVVMRKQRITHLLANQFKQLLTALPIRQDNYGDDCVLTSVFEMAHELELTAYDATYLELAFREKIAIATQDKALIKAAQRIGVLIYA